jgi:hypothetical protein
MNTQNKNQIRLPHAPENRSYLTEDQHMKFVEVNVKASLDGHDIKWIAEQFGFTPEYVNAKRVEFRKAGVVLPELSRGRVGNPIDTDALNSLIAQIKNPTPARGRGGRTRQHVGSAA